MNDMGPDRFEVELRQLRPARAPEQFVKELHKVVDGESSRLTSLESGSKPHELWRNWRSWLKWLLPATGVAALLALMVIVSVDRDSAPLKAAKENVTPAVIDEVELDKQLVAAFEGVASMPGGLPLRFRCYGWQEALTLRDASGRVEVEQQRPYVELVPMGFDVY